MVFGLGVGHALLIASKTFWALAFGSKQLACRFRRRYPLNTSDPQLLRIPHIMRYSDVCPINTS